MTLSLPFLRDIYGGLIQPKIGSVELLVEIAKVPGETELDPLLSRPIGETGVGGQESKFLAVWGELRVLRDLRKEVIRV